MSKIEWTDKTWNPVTGCSPISPGCDNCYAKRMAVRLAGRYGYPAEDPFTPGTFHHDKINQPLEWITAKKIFVCSMGDLFHQDVPDWMIDGVFDRILYDGISHHTFQILTKRADRLAEYCNQDHIKTCLETRENIWVGVTVENQEQADIRIPELLKVPVAVRFVSVEPMLGPVDIFRYRPSVDWVICGGETGPGAREMKPEWALDLKRQCVAAGVPFFMKQMSRKVAIPPYLQGRQFPSKGPVNV